MRFHQRKLVLAKSCKTEAKNFPSTEAHPQTPFQNVNVLLWLNLQFPFSLWSITRLSFFLFAEPRLYSNYEHTKKKNNPIIIGDALPVVCKHLNTLTTFPTYLTDPWFSFHVKMLTSKNLEKLLIFTKPKFLGNGEDWAFLKTSANDFARKKLRQSALTIINLLAKLVAGPRVTTWNSNTIAIKKKEKKNYI